MARLRRGDGTLIRDLNRAAILGLVWEHGLIARVEIARRLALSAAAVTDITRELVDDGILREVEEGASSGGRRPILLGLVGPAAQAIGVKIASDHLAIVRVALDGAVLLRATEAFEAARPDALDRLVRVLAAAVEGSGAFPGRLLGVGLGMPGIVDANGVVQAPTLGWSDVPMGPLLHARLSVPVLVDNDVNTLAVAERLYGLGRGLEHTITITIGRGVGLGIVVGGELYRGARGGAGEFGHLPVDPAGPACTCGRRGCLEALVGEAALVRTAIGVGVVGVDDPRPVAALRQAADAGDARARSILGEAGATLGRAVAGLVNILSPQRVIVSGEGIQAWDHWAIRFDDALRSAVFPPLTGVEVQVDPWDDAKWARGAAALVLKATFSAPLYERQPEDAVRERLPGRIDGERGALDQGRAALLGATGGS
jgi:predicted NBD/HSP70 family sugar kinase